ncbi:MAG: hypothetical protein ABSA92_14290 [Candidatus Bathyarchaeia archaeon]
MDLEHKILIFIDLPHWQLMAKLRPFLSHDRKLLRYNITDKTGKGGLRAKTVVIKGFASTFFCTTSDTQDEQENTRMMKLYPETTPEKFMASLQLLAKKIANRRKFKAWMESHPKRQWLIERVRRIRESGVTDVEIPDPNKVLGRYLEGGRRRLTARSQRDFPRCLAMIKGSVLRNVFTRQKIDYHTILANDIDIESAFALYERISLPNELGLSVESWRVFNEILPRLPNAHVGVRGIDVLKKYFEVYGRTLSHDVLQRVILPELQSAGIVELMQDPADARQSLIRVEGDGGKVSEANEPPTDEEVTKVRTWLEQQPGKQAEYTQFEKVARGPVIQATVDRGIIRVLTVQPPLPDIPTRTIVYLNEETGAAVKEQEPMKGPEWSGDPWDV